MKVNGCISLVVAMIHPAVLSSMSFNMNPSHEHVVVVLVPLAMFSVPFF